jgi:hypothetical protein
MAEFLIRTEDFKAEDVLKYFVEAKTDRRIIETLKGRMPGLLIGSRGVGKSLLLRVAQAELLRDFQKNRVFPVYCSFTRSSLMQGATAEQFHAWMLARVCSAIIRALAKEGLLAVAPRALAVIAGQPLAADLAPTKIEGIADAFENLWRSNQPVVDINEVPSVDDLREAIEDICGQLKIDRISLFIDEAAHIFLPRQQRQFFTLFRDLRSPYLTCNAAVYPGVTSYGDTFQPAHDATVLTIDRDVTDAEYEHTMREIVEKQADSDVIRNIVRNGQNFAVLAYAATGNPRVLLKTLARASRVSSTEVNEVIRSYYRTDAWAEHSLLSEKYPGHRTLIDWGRRFIEDIVLPDLKSKNDSYMKTDRGTSCFFWVHRDVPEAARQALRILAYTGLVVEHSSGIKATRGEIGTRYLVNLGCLFALESVPNVSAFPVAKNLTIKRMTEFGATHPAFSELVNTRPSLDDDAVNAQALQAQLSKPVDVLDITDWQKLKLHELGMDTVGHVLSASEADLQKAYYIGDVRSRRMRNAAVAAVFEYLSG